MWLSCHTEKEIAEAVGLAQRTVSDKIDVLAESFPETKLLKLSKFELDVDGQGETKPDATGWTRPVQSLVPDGKAINL